MSKNRLLTGKNRLASGAIAIALAALCAPASAQNSESYKFLKAVREGDGAAVETILSASSPVLVNARDSAKGESALHIVAADRNLAWLRYLIGKGARVDVQNANGDSPLAIAAQLGWVEGADQLLARGASVDLANRRGETALILAVQRRDLAMVRLLLAEGADPARPDRVAGYSALDYARRDGRSAMILKALEAPPAKKESFGPKL